MFDEKKIMQEASTSDPFTNQMRIISLGIEIRNLRNTIEHLHANTTPDCQECGAKHMNFNLSTYEWNCSNCDY